MFNDVYHSPLRRVVSSADRSLSLALVVFFILSGIKMTNGRQEPMSQISYTLFVDLDFCLFFSLRTPRLIFNIRSTISLQLCVRQTVVQQRAPLLPSRRQAFVTALRAWGE
jgi:hypothetical protein